MDRARQDQQTEISEKRRIQVGTGDRSERIRTYNFPQGRVTDHRIGLTLYRIGEILEGELDEIIDALTTHYQAEALTGEMEIPKFKTQMPGDQEMTNFKVQMSKECPSPISG